MDNQNQKWVSLSFLAFSALVWFVLLSLLQGVAGLYDLEARVPNADLMIRGLALGVGALFFLVLLRHRQANEFMGEVIAELFRVTWPSQKDTVRATIVVMIMVVISGLVLGGLDSLWRWLLQMVL